MKDWRDHVKFVAEIVGVIVLIIYTIYTAKMYRVNGKAADAATSAATTAETTMRLDQRAWVAVPSVNGTKPELNQKLVYAVHLVDTGKTPAVKVVVHPGDELLPMSRQPDLSLETEPLNLGVLSPGSERTYENGPVPNSRKPTTLTKADLANLKTLRLWVHGKVTYEDVFGVHHWITYCAFLRDDWSGYSFCQQGNDTDR